MNPLVQCTMCCIFFTRPAKEEISGLTRYFCPSCGGDHEGFEEVAATFEICFFYEIIERSYARRDRMMLRNQADRGMKMPDA